MTPQAVGSEVPPHQEEVAWGTRRLLLYWGLWVLVTPLAFLLRLEGAVNWHAAGVYLLCGALLKWAVLRLSGQARFGRRVVLDRDWPATVRLILTGQLALLLLALPLRALGYVPLPLTVPVIEGLLALALLLGWQLWQRAQEERRAVQAAVGGQRTLILGAGQAGHLIAGEMLRNPKSGLQPVAFLDDDPGLHGTTLLGLPVLGPIQGCLAPLAAQVGAERIVMAMPSAAGDLVRRIHEEARSTGLAVQVMPSLSSLLLHQPQVPQLRSMNLEDLLRREPAQLNHEDIGEYLTGRTVMVTGAGGSIGGELARQVARYRPGHLILFGRGENSIFAIQQELASSFPELHQTAIIGDVRHQRHLESIFEHHRPEVVFHAAAHKHVPLMEDSPSEAIYNNVIGTRILTRLCLEFGVRRFVNISSDKAVNPTSVMGASKRLAEMVISVGAQRAQPTQAFMSVRFGNVLGSRGSVVPTFLRQIEAGGPVTITDERMTRYFMTIPEAARLVLQAGALAGNGSVYVLNMGEPVRIVDLARDLIRLSGRDVELRVTGIRRGEKLYEELLTTRESVDQTTHQEIFVARLDTPDPEWLRHELAVLEGYARDEDYPLIREQLRRMIPESRVAPE